MTHDLLKLAEECESKLMGLAVIRAVAPQLGNTCDELTLTLSKIYAALRAAHEEMRTAREAYTNICTERDNLQAECDRLRAQLVKAEHVINSAHMHLDKFESAHNGTSGVTIRVGAKDAFHALSIYLIERDISPFAAIEAAMKEETE